MTQPSTTLLSTLREATHDDHERLERITLGNKIMEGTLSPAEYRRLEAWQRRVHEVLEPELIGFQYDTYSYRPRFVSPTDHPTDTSPGAWARKLGLAYVLEGSSLGGSLILRKLQTNPQLSGEAPFSFYQKQADWGVQQWREYRAALDKTSFSDAEVEQAVAGARYAFGRFEAEWQAMP